ncbi:unnamed protein product [Clonostachys rosea f. rosea IK726]|uniref:Uncharacterized protein n=1 Tax=Clonostachys rosea f. rosea IK726 TaxID=1349383 RepID=A0ACA9UQR0_BIOOC|nr:unnamed protein product [Clonostachys rosea f. rosea IK726]
MMGSNQDTTSAVGIADLPLDVLRQIFAVFEPSYGSRNGKIDFPALNSFFSSDEYRTIKNARLACWALNVASSPLLCPILNLSLNQASLERVKNLCSNPLILYGIQGVQICLTYRPSEMANSLQRYKDFRLRELQGIYDTHGQSQEQEHDSHWSYGDHEGSDALHFSTLRRAWNIGSNTKHMLSDEEKSYQDLLKESYETYKEHHEAQLRLISEKIFVYTVASLLARFNHPPSLHLVSYPYPPRAPGSRMPLASRSNFLQFMDAPHDWDSIEKFTNGLSAFNLSKLLVDLPIACHEAGAVPRHMLKLGISTGKDWALPPNGSKHFTLAPFSTTERFPIQDNSGLRSTKALSTNYLDLLLQVPAYIIAALIWTGLDCVAEVGRSTVF